MTAQPTRDRILFIDDDPPVRTAFQRSVRLEGFDTDLADGAAQAIEMAADTEYAVIATDFRMPEVNGLELIHKLRQTQPNATYILVSGETDLELALEAVNNNNVAFVVPKPWDSAELGTMLRRGVESYWERSAQSAVQRNMVEASRGLREQKERLEKALADSEATMAEALLNALEARNYETRAHCRRVAGYARIIASELGIRGHALSSIQQGAMLHDVGMIGVADEIVSKPGPLTPEERDIVRTHPLMGARILDGIEALRSAREVVMQHHERYNGGGYPRGLAGEEIVIGARIFAVADALDAMLSRRPYKEPMAFQDAAKEIAQGSGGHFDPKIVEAFNRIPAERWDEVRQAHPDETTSGRRQKNAAA